MGKYRDRLNQVKKKYMESILKSYPEICAKLPEQRTRNDRRRIDLVESLLATVDRMPDAAKRRTLIDMVYFEQSCGVMEAASKVPIQPKTAIRWNIEAIEIMLGIIQLP